MAKKIRDDGARRAPECAVALASPTASSEGAVAERRLCDWHGVLELQVVQPDTRTPYLCFLESDL